MEVQGNARWRSLIVIAALTFAINARSNGDTATGTTTTTTTSSSTTTTSPTSSGVDYSYAGTVTGTGINVASALKQFVEDWNPTGKLPFTDANFVTAVGGFSRNLEEARRILRYAGFFVLSDEERRVSNASLNLADVQYLDQQHGFDYGILRSFGRSEGFGVGIRYNASESQPALRGAFQDLRIAVHLAETRLGDVRVDRESTPAARVEKLRTSAIDLEPVIEKLYASAYRAIYGLRVGLVADYIDIGGTRLAAEGAGIAQLFPFGPFVSSQVAPEHAVPMNGLLLAGSVRELDFNQSGGHTSARAFGGTLAWQWTARQPKKAAGAEYIRVDYSWSARLGAEFNVTSPRVGDDYTGVFVAFRPKHDVELRLYARTSGRPSLFGARVSVGIP